MPVSLNLEEASAPVVTDHPFAGVAAEQPILLPDSPALVCEGGVVVQANLAVARLAGRRLPESLIGLSLNGLLLDSGGDAELVRPDGRATPVRVARWSLPGTGLLVLFLVDISDLHSASDALRTERRRLAEVERLAGIGSWEFDPATGSTRWSRGHYEILGVEPGTVISGTDAVLSKVHPQDRDRLAGTWGEHLATGAPLDTEYRVLRADGGTRTISARAEVHHDAWGRSIHHIGCIRDVTEQRRVDHELTAERIRLLEAQRIARIGSFTLDCSTGVLDCSPALSELFGVHHTDVTDLAHVVHPEDLAGLRRQVQELVAHPADGIVQAEFRGLPDRGDTFYLCRLRVERSGSEERGGAEPVRLAGTVQDVTEARVLDRELREERRRLAATQRVARIGTWEWEPGTARVVWSEMLQELYGVTETPVTTYQSYLGRVHPHDRRWVDELWRRLAVDHLPVECEHRVLRPDGAVRVFRCHGAALADPSGALRLVGTAQDVTDQRATETRMERSSRRFADLVAIAPVGIGIFDDSERLVDANDALCTLLGYDLETLRGRTFAVLTHPDEREQPLPARTGTTAGSSPVSQRMLLRADGVAVCCELRISVSVQDDGQRFMLVVVTDTTERRRAAEVLRHQTTRDDLTGLPNRAAIKEMLTEQLAASDRDVAVLFCDIDNFKRINDSLGHDAGDELLIALARRLQDGLPPGCTAARLSGDVFVVICSGVTAQGGVEALVETAAGVLRTAVGVRGRLVRVSPAIGAAVADDATTGPDDLLRFADAALFQAKRQCTGQVALAGPALMASADRQVELECQLREALLNDELELHYQPVVGPDGTVHAAEALIRWPHPERGMLPPSVFLPVAEQGDLMRELDRWVLRTALHEARGWVTPDGRPISVAMNLAGMVPGEPDFVATVATAVAESGMSWDRIVLELVETALADLPPQSRGAMAELVERGVRFAVDDFGTGYSSLARLKELPAQIVKLDRQFVSGLGKDPVDLALARAVVDMADAMDCRCVAEGVETVAQFELLRGLGVHAYQGWLFSRAVSRREFRALLGLGPSWPPAPSPHPEAWPAAP